MSLWRQLTAGLRVLTRRRAADQDLADEVRHYVDEATAEYVARGWTPDAARRAACRDVGGVTRVREHVRDGGWERIVAETFGDVRMAGRMLRRTPIVTLVCVLVIALGSGAVTTVYSAMHALVLRPIAEVAEPGTLVAVERTRRDGSGTLQSTSPHFRLLQQRARTVDLGAWSKASITLAARDTGTIVFGNLVSGNFFTVLGLRPALGRFFLPDEDRTPLTHPVIVVSHRFWRSALGADPASVGGPLTVNGRRFTLIGVAPAGFTGLTTGLPTDAWVPLAMQPLLKPRTHVTRGAWLWVFGRLKDGVTPDVARQELAALTTAHMADAGESAGPDAFPGVHISALTGVPHRDRGTVLVFMSLLLGAASLVLLISAVNVAALLSARALARRREMAVRVALGAGRARLVRQLLTEVLLLFVLGALGGMAIAAGATAAIEQVPLPASLPLALELSPDLRVLAFALGTSLVTGLAFGLIPAFRAARTDVTTPLRQESPGSGLRRTRFGRALVVAQLAGSLVLLVAAGLFLRALDRGLQVDAGFDLSRVATASLDPEAWGYDAPRARAFYATLRARLATLPGIEAVSFADRAPLSMGSSVNDITIDAGSPLSIHTASIDVDYFAVLQLPLLHGRPFATGDRDGGVAVAIVNETLARRLSPDGQALGRAFTLDGTRLTIVGIARDSKYATLGEDTPPFAYVPMAQRWQHNQSLLVRTTGDPLSVAAGIDQVIASIDPASGRPRLLTLQQSASVVLLPQRMAALVIGALGVVGLVMATAGLYGVLAYTARRRTREIGIRVALGAQRSQVVGLMLGEGLRLAGLGLLVGLALAAMMTRALAGWLFGLSPLDPLAFGGMTLLFGAIALVASYLPARRAAAADPLDALRVE